ncbi:hypothetical protein [Arthrobacter sp. VKM Ac-2550]|uniref:hypothetical protein n=1 Tax=Crystallibacter permensis TaxID=1938888 RepID=UPI002226A997|nr:hypothetical protein [Arthrobacter sp. VKM Ac-2550]
MAGTAALAVLLAGCASSPTTTYQAGGQEITVDWAEYPGHAYTAAEDVLQAPPAEELEAVSGKLLGEIEARLTDEFGHAWEDGPDDGESFFPQEGNGYGGDSLYVSFNSVPRESLAVPEDPQDWQRAVDIVSEVTESYGLGKLELGNLEPALAEETAERLGSTELQHQWQWFGDAYGQSQWVSLTLTDVERDPTGEAVEEMKGSIEYGWNPRSITISYGATTVRNEDREQFLAALEPFEGLDRPEATTSD